MSPGGGAGDGEEGFWAERRIEEKPEREASFQHLPGPAAGARWGPSDRRWVLLTAPVPLAATCWLPCCFLGRQGPRTSLCPLAPKESRDTRLQVEAEPRPASPPPLRQLAQPPSGSACPRVSGPGPAPAPGSAWHRGYCGWSAGGQQLLPHPASVVPVDRHPRHKGMGGRGGDLWGLL